MSVSSNTIVYYSAGRIPVSLRGLKKRHDVRVGEIVAVCDFPMCDVLVCGAYAYGWAGKDLSHAAREILA